MRKDKHKNLAFRLCALLGAAIVCHGCGIVSLLGTPTRHEKKVAAEYDLIKHKNKRILVLVDQPAWLDAQANLRYYLTEAINDQLSRKIKFLPEYVVSYGQLSEFRAHRTDLASLSAVEVGAALRAEAVLLVGVRYCELKPLGDRAYYKASLGAQAALFDVGGGARLWPQPDPARSIRVGFEIESRGREVAVSRLAAAAAHCVVRYFYNCPQDRFKIAEEIAEVEW